jgi:FkbM family methyltransferase
MRNLQNKSGLLSWRPGYKFRSELEEDLFLCDYFEFKRGGFVLDIGAADGITASNSFKLINEYDWKGLLIEPCIEHLSNLQILYDDVEDVDYFLGAIDQEQTESIFYQVCNNEIGFSNTKGHPYTRDQEFITYQVPCLDINTTLKKYNVPKNIDFISLDIEGSENEVLYNWNFSEYPVTLWCVEQNIYDYKSFFHSHGYERIVVPEKFNVCSYNAFYEKVA